MKDDPYFSATKISWILENVSGARLVALKANWLWHRRYFSMAFN